MNTPDTPPAILEHENNLTSVSMAVIYHSNYGHTKRVAEAVVTGARQQLPDSQVKAVDVHDVDWDFVDQADLLVFGSAVYMGSVTAGFKTFMDETSKRWYHRKWEGKWAAGFANSGGLSGDKLAVLQQICLYAMQHGMNWIGLPLMPTGHEAHDLNRLSSDHLAKTIIKRQPKQQIVIAED